MELMKIHGVWYAITVLYKSVGIGKTISEAKQDFAHKLHKELDASIEGADAVRRKVSKQYNLRSKKQFKDHFWIVGVYGRWYVIGGRSLKQGRSS